MAEKHLCKCVLVKRKDERRMMKSKKGFILYFDILGYKEVVSDVNSPASEIYRKNLEICTDKLFDFDLFLMLDEDKRLTEERVFRRSFSDNFLFLYVSECYDDIKENKRKCKNYVENLQKVMELASLIQEQCLLMGMLTRGSISYGEIDYNNEIIFGNAVINAVTLEENHKEPFIVLSDDLKKILKLHKVDYREHINLTIAHRTDKNARDNLVQGINTYFDLGKVHSEKIRYIVCDLNEYFKIDDDSKIQICTDGINYKAVIGKVLNISNE